MTPSKMPKALSPLSEKAEAIKLVIVSAMMMDYGLRIAMGKTEPSLNVICNKILGGIKDLENHFIHFPNVHPKYKEIFRKEFAKKK